MDKILQFKDMTQKQIMTKIEAMTRQERLDLQQSLKQNLQQIIQQSLDETTSDQSDDMAEMVEFLLDDFIAMETDLIEKTKDLGIEDPMNYVVPAPEKCTNDDIHKAAQLAYVQMDGIATPQFIEVIEDMIRKRNTGTLTDDELKDYYDMALDGHGFIAHMILTETPKLKTELEKWVTHNRQCPKCRGNNNLIRYERIVTFGDIEFQPEAEFYSQEDLAEALEKKYPGWSIYTDFDTFEDENGVDAIHMRACDNCYKEEHKAQNLLLPVE